MASVFQWAGSRMLLPSRSRFSSLAPALQMHRHAGLIRQPLRDPYFSQAVTTNAPSVLSTRSMAMYLSATRIPQAVSAVPRRCPHLRNSINETDASSHHTALADSLGRAASARICSGVVPQQPPRIRAPAFRQRITSDAKAGASMSKTVVPFTSRGIPALGLPRRGAWSQRQSFR